MRRRFIIYASEFDENSGGPIALHRLCDLLNKAGERAYLWPFNKPVFDRRRPLSSVAGLADYWWNGGPSRVYQVFERFETPVADRSKLRGSIVVYPEVVDGNPLCAERVVRWLLHKPGFHTGRVNFGSTDKVFFFQEAFNDPRVNPDRDNFLRTLFVRDDIYRRVNTGPRSGTCHILRKGARRPLVHDASKSILVDGKPHRELADIFNRVEMCISYDPYTMYSVFAALCGCVSVVVPQEGVSIAEWYPDPADRYGLAYGFDDVPRAVATQHLLLPHLKAQEKLANASVNAFIRKCERYFPA